MSTLAEHAAELLDRWRETGEHGYRPFTRAVAERLAEARIDMDHPSS
jgi:hypothetical protein